MPNDPTTYYFTQGVLGVTVVVLAGVAWKFYTKIQQLQDARLQDQKDVTKENGAIIASNAEAMRILAAKIETGKRGGS